MPAASRPLVRPTRSRPSRGTAPAVGPGSPRGAYAAAIRGNPAATTRLPDRVTHMMDTQRLIALIVFSFSALLLWDAWQKHGAPKTVSAPMTTAPGIPAPSQVGASTPSVPLSGVAAPSAPAAAGPLTPATAATAG